MAEDREELPVQYCEERDEREEKQSNDYDNYIDVLWWLLKST